MASSGKNTITIMYMWVGYTLENYCVNKHEQKHCQQYNYFFFIFALVAPTFSKFFEYVLIRDIYDKVSYKSRTCL